MVTKAAKMSRPISDAAIAAITADAAAKIHPEFTPLSTLLGPAYQEAPPVALLKVMAR